MKSWILSFFILLIGPSALAETWKIVTLDWPPYTYDSLNGDQGAACKAFADLMKTVGVKIEYVFLPWSRGTYEVKKPGYVGLFPVWKNESFRGGKNSPLLFTSPIVFVHNKNKIHKWKSLKDFKGLNIGIVENYGYPAEILELGKKGFYNLKAVATDEQNLRMLSFQRIDLTVVDLFNARYLTEIRHPELQKKLYLDPKVYENAELYVSLKDDPFFKSRVEKIKKALKIMPMQEQVDLGMKRIFAKSSQPETKKTP